MYQILLDYVKHLVLLIQTVLVLSYNYLLKTNEAQDSMGLRSLGSFKSVLARAEGGGL